VLPGVAEEYARLYDELRGVEKAEIVSAVALTDAEAERLVTALGSREDKVVELERRVEAGLIGGAILKIGNTVIDGSVKRRLEELKHRLLAVQVH